MIKFQPPVLFDANIILNFKGQLDNLFGYFENILIHDKVYSEVLSASVKKELDEISERMNIKYVADFKCIDDDSKALFKKCDQELRETFDIDNNNDLGEYKTLMYAKFNRVCFLSRIDKNTIDFERRRCVKDYSLNDYDCKCQRKEFKKKIRNMERK